MQQIYSRTPMPKCNFKVQLRLLCNFIEITLWHEYSPVNLQHIFRTPFPRNTFGRLLLNFVSEKRIQNPFNHEDRGFCEMVNDWQPLTIFAKSFILNNWQSSVYAHISSSRNTILNNSFTLFKPKMAVSVKLNYLGRQ